jgi:hypothetical protein
MRARRIKTVQNSRDKYNIIMKDRTKTPLGVSPLLAALALYVALVGCGGVGGSASSSNGDSPLPPSQPAPSGGSDTIAPTIPQSLSATALSSSEVNLAWAPVTDNVGVTGYRIFRNGGLVGTITTSSYRDGALAPATQYTYRVAAFDAAGNTSAQSGPVSATTFATGTGGNVFQGNPSNYLSLLRGLRAGDTLVLDPGNYDDVNDVPGLPIFNLNGEPSRPITIKGPDSGPRPVLLGRSTHNTIRFSDASYIVVRNLEIDGRNLGGDGVNAQGAAHDITLENLSIHGVGSNQQVVGISTNGAPTWNWIVRNNEIVGAGTGLYLGNPNGTNPFVAGLIERNLVRDTIGYNIQIKHQDSRPNLAGMPTGNSSTIIRHNVFSKSGNSSTGAEARPNVLVGHFPLSGVGVDDVYEIYGNFFYQNPTEALFQGEGNIAFHHNLLVNDSGSAVNIQPHNDVPRMVRVFHNTVVASGTGTRVTGGSAAFRQVVVGNAVFAASPISASDQSQNITGGYQSATNTLNNAFGALGQLDLFPRVGMLKGSAIDTSTFNSFIDWNQDFNGAMQDETSYGAYSGSGVNPGWLPLLEIKP